MNQELPYESFDDEGKVVCQICGKSYEVISPRHLAVHKIQYADYTTRYPDAPLSSDTFNAKSKYGKNSTLFVDDKDINDDVLDEEVYVDEEPELEELELENALANIVEGSRDPMVVQKMRVLDHLRLHFVNIEKDYTVRYISPISKKLIFEYITDFCDPILKLIIQFPNTFWHNKDGHVDSLKYNRLKDQKWKVLTVKSRSPSGQDIDSVIDSM
jgi:hypothetical protein